MSKGKIFAWVIVALVALMFLKQISLWGAIVALIAVGYFGIKAIANDDNRKNLLKNRVLPITLVAMVCIFVNIAMNKSSTTTAHYASSTKVSSSSSSKKDESMDDESDSESSDDYDDSSTDSNDDYDTNDDSSTATSNDDNNTDKAQGDMETDQQGTIVGNSRTMVYHTPDQQGYRMNSANAVYFNTEAEAQAAGYRKSAR